MIVTVTVTVTMTVTMIVAVDLLGRGGRGAPGLRELHSSDRTMWGKLFLGFEQCDKSLCREMSVAVGGSASLQGLLMIKQAAS
jgi:hypothetical protein